MWECVGLHFGLRQTLFCFVLRTCFLHNEPLWFILGLLVFSRQQPFYPALTITAKTHLSASSSLSVFFFFHCVNICRMGILLVLIICMHLIISFTVGLFFHWSFNSLALVLVANGSGWLKVGSGLFCAADFIRQWSCMYFYWPMFFLISTQCRMQFFGELQSMANN